MTTIRVTANCTLQEVGIVTKPTLRTRPWDFGRLSAKTRDFGRLSAKTRNCLGGKLFSGMITTLFRGHHEQYCIFTPERAHTTQHFKSTPSYAEVWALGVLASSSHAQLASLFLMCIRCCASGFGSVKTFLAAPASCTVLKAFSYYPTACGLAVCCPSSLQLQLQRSFGA